MDKSQFPRSLENYLQNGTAQAQQLQNQIAASQASFYPNQAWNTAQNWVPEKVRPTITVHAADVKLRLKIAQLIDALPMSVCARIPRVEFYPAFQEAPAQFVVHFDNQKQLIFQDIDAFPTEQDLAQIALDCP